MRALEAAASSHPAPAKRTDQATNSRGHRLDLDHDGSWSGSGEMDDSATFNVANEQLTQELDSTPGTTGNNYSLKYDDAGIL